MRLEPHFQAIVEACKAMTAIAKTLPETDSIMELKSILSVQAEVLACMLESKHAGSKYLEDFSIYCQQTCIELEKQIKD